MNSVVRQGFGFLKENQDASLGDDYWMLDVDMDCESAVNVGGTFWFEVRSFMTNSPIDWEPDVNQADRPYVSGNHFAKCGKINIFQRGSSAVTYADFDTVNQCSIPNQERRCNARHSANVRLGRRRESLAKFPGMRPVKPALSNNDRPMLYTVERPRNEP